MNPQQLITIICNADLPLLTRLHAEQVLNNIQYYI